MRPLKPQNLVIVYLLLLLGMSTALALLSVTFEGDVLVENDLTVEGTITGALDIYTIEQENVDIGSGQFLNRSVSCSDNNDIAIDGGFGVQTGDTTDFDITNTYLQQAEFDDLEMDWDNAEFVAGFHNHAAGTLTMFVQVTCLVVPGVQTS